MTALPENPMEPVLAHVTAVRDEIARTVSLELAPAGGTFLFAPGQFTMLYAFGVGEVPISISGDPDHPDRLVHTIRGVGAVSNALCRLTAGQTVGVRGPFGTSWPLETAAGGDLLLVAGGIGLAPLRPALYRALARRDWFRNVVLLYGARTPDELLFRTELIEWGGRLDATVLVTVDNATEGWHGAVGVVTNLVRRAPFTPAAASAFVCGPEIMMRFAAKALIEEGVAPDRIHVSMERNMECAIGVCGHCQFGPAFVCRDGPVFRYDRVEDLLWVKEI